MTYTVSSPDRSGMVCQVTSTDAAHGFRLVSDYITDPARASVVMHTTLEPLNGGARSGQRAEGLRPLRRDDRQHRRRRRDQRRRQRRRRSTRPRPRWCPRTPTAPTGPFAAQVVGALVANRPFLAESSGFVGHAQRRPRASSTPTTGWSTTTGRPTDGNVVQTALIDTDARAAVHARPRLRARPPQRAIATATAQRARAVRRARWPRYEAGWRAYDAALRRRPRHCRASPRRRTRRCSARTGCRPT